MATPLRALILEDRPADAELILHELRRAGFEPIWQRVETEADYLAQLHEGLDVILADYTLPQFDALRALHLLQERGLDIPFIIATGSISEEVAVECMKEGAADYLLKDRLARLGLAVGQALKQKRLRDEKRQAEKALRASEEKYRLHFENVSDVIYSIDNELRVLSVSPSAEKVLGYKPEELIGRPFPELNVLAPGCLEVASSDIMRVLAGERVVSEYEFIAKDGTRMVGEVSGAPLFSPDGSVVAVVSVARDITKRKRAEKQIQRHLQRIAALREIDRAITASLDLRFTFNVILDQATAQLGVDAADVLLLNPHTQTLEYAAGQGFRFGVLQHSNLRLGDGYAGQAALERRIVSIPHLEEAENGLRRAPLLPQEEFISYYAVPLIAKGQAKGVLEIFHRARLDPDPEWLGFLETLAGQAAIAIDNATLFNDLQRSNIELALAYDTTLEGWAKALELRDRETEGHTRRVSEMTLRLAHAMGMSEVELVHVRRGAILHDIGKIAISDTILLKPGPLTDEEWEIMRQHPVYAYGMLSSITYLRPALNIPGCHHEKWDGTGYPRALKGEQIPLAARIFAVVDVWDALLSDRPYRPAWPEEKAIEYIREQAGKQFDPQVVETFLKLEMGR